MEAIHTEPRDVETRCPLCREPLEGDLWECPSCRTRFHAVCTRELGGGCSTLGCAELRRRTEPATTAKEASRPPSRAWFVFAAVATMLVAWGVLPILVAVDSKAPDAPSRRSWTPTPPPAPQRVPTVWEPDLRVMWRLGLIECLRSEGAASELALVRACAAHAVLSVMRRTPYQEEAQTALIAVARAEGIPAEKVEAVMARFREGPALDPRFHPRASGSTTTVKPFLELAVALSSRLVADGNDDASLISAIREGLEACAKVGQPIGDDDLHAWLGNLPRATRDELVSRMRSRTW